MPYLGIFELEFKNGMSCLKSAPSNLSKDEFLSHTLNFGTGSTFSKCPGPTFSEGLGLDLIKSEI